MLDYPEDVARIVGAMAAAGLRVLPEDMESLWYYHSDQMDAGWLCLPSDDSAIVQAILRAAFQRNYAN